MSNIVLKWLKLNWEVFPCKSTNSKIFPVEDTYTRNRNWIFDGLGNVNQKNYVK